MVKVSIIVPVYNTELYLDKCISSLINQSLQEIEILLINDGSTDNSLDICNHYSQLDSRVKVYSIPNSGSAMARNVGLKNSVGEYIGFVDSDDWVDLNMYKKLYDLANNNGAEIVSLNFVKGYLNKSVFNKIDYKDGIYFRNDLINKIYPNLICNENLDNNVPYTMVTKIFKRSLIIDNNITFYDPLLGGQDMVFSIECFLHCNKFYLSKNDYYYHYVFNKKSRTNRYMENAWKVYKSTNSYFRKITSEYKSFDFSNQVEYDLLRGAMTAINYELKVGNNKTLKYKLKMIRQICNDSSLKNIYELIDSNTLTFQRKILFNLMKNDKALLIYTLSVVRKLINILMWRY